MTELLDLNTVVDRDSIRLRSKRHTDGKAYDLINADELGAFEHAMLNKLLGIIQRLSSIANRKLTVKEERDLRKALGDVLKMIVLEIEPATLNELEDVQRAKIISAWSRQFIGSGAAEGEAPPPARRSRSTTASSSRASRRSTAETPKPGSTSRRTR